MAKKKDLLKDSFWFNVLLAVLLIVGLGVLFFASLGWITHHGETIKVPDVAGRSYQDAKTLLTSQDFKVEVQDSSFVDSLPPLSVVRQSPEGDYIVKVNRTIYLTLNKAQPPMTAMPDLVNNYSYRSAAMMLQSQHLNIGDTIYKADIAKNSVLEQLYNNKPIKPGAMIPQGSKISLVLGNGLGNVEFPMPNFIGLTFMQARDLLSASNLNMGLVTVSGQVSDTANAYVYRQSPSAQQANTMVRAGEIIDLWIAQQMPAQPDSSNNNLNQY